MCPGGRKDTGGWQSPRFKNERSRGRGRLCSIPVFLGPFIACQSREWVSRNTTKGPGITSLCVKAPEYKGSFFDLEVKAQQFWFLGQGICFLFPTSVRLSLT